jgi:hypothetical protein
VGQHLAHQMQLNSSCEGGGGEVGGLSV